MIGSNAKACYQGNDILCFIRGAQFINHLSSYQLLRMDFASRCWFQVTSWSWANAVVVVFFVVANYRL
jgi:hypothetical protein